MSGDAGSPGTPFIFFGMIDGFGSSGSSTAKNLLSISHNIDYRNKGRKILSADPRDYENEHAHGGMSKKEKWVSKRKCTIAGCGGVHVGRGYCGKHWARWKSSGDPLRLQRTEKGLRAAFVQKALNFSSRGTCLLWPFKLGGKSYGTFSHNKRRVYVHQYLCAIRHGPPPTASHEVAHNCGNQLCVNPKHLRWATRTENQADRKKHGTEIYGEAHPNAKLTLRAVKEIRKLNGAVPDSVLAARFRVSPGAIKLVRKNKLWRHYV